MEENKIDYQLLARYLAGECSPEDQEKIHDWKEKSYRNTEKLNELQRIWAVAESPHTEMADEFDVKKEWDRLHRRMQEEEGDPNRKKKVNSSGYSIHSTAQQMIRVAAILLVVALAGFWGYQNWEPEERSTEESTLRELSTAKGQRANLTLGDGSKVLLNAESTISLPKHFDEDLREVSLEGEAYFQIAENAERPFVIHSRGSVIRVLGTSFSVRSYPEDTEVQVFVEEGKVAMDPNSESKQAVITADQLGRLHTESGNIETENVKDRELYLSWKDGYLKFKEKTMGQVALELERRYDIEVIFEDPSIKEKTLTAFLKSRSVENVMEVIAMSLDINYQLEEDTLTFLTE